MKNLFVIVAILFSVTLTNALASSSEQILKEAYPGHANVQNADLSTFPAKVKGTFLTVDIPLEMGDGHYDALSRAYYQVTDSKGTVVGYLQVDLLLYTEGPEVFLGAAYVTPDGVRLNITVELDMFERARIPELPPELQPQVF